MRRLHPSTVVVAFLPEVVKAIKTALPFLFVSLFSSKNDWEELIAPLIGIVSGFGAISAFITTRYGVEEGHLVFRRGWLFRQDRRIPIEQIQNLNVRQGILERLFKVVTLEVETAAGAGAEMKLQVITADAAELLKSELLLSEKKVEESATEHRHEMPLEDLLLGGMSENHFGNVFGYLLTLFLGGAALKFIQFELAVLQALPPWIPWLLGAALIGITIGLGWVYGIVSYCLKYGRFSVVRDEDRYRINHGVFTKNQYVARLAKVESIVITATLWQRMLHRCNLSIGTAGSFGEQGALAPTALMLPEMFLADRVRAVLPEIALDKLDWHPIPRRYAWVLVGRTLFWTAIFIGLLFMVRSTGSVLTNVVSLVLVSGVLLLLSSLLGLYRAGYAVNDHVVASRFGYLTQTTTVMPLNKIDLISTSQPLFWQKGGVVALQVKAMTHALKVPMVRTSFAEDLEQRLGAESRDRQNLKNRRIRDESDIYLTKSTALWDVDEIR